MESAGGASDGEVTQFAVLDALLAGAYDSGISARELRGLGDFGLGCCEGLGGEVIILDGQAYECTLGAPPTLMRDDETLPFAEVCRFGDGRPQSIERVDLPKLTATVEAGLVSRNLFHAVRLDGWFERVQVRVTPKQRHPYPSLVDVTREQVETDLTATRGTLVGFWVPAIYQGLAVAGMHLHYLSDDRRAGGHVLDVSVASAEMRLIAYSRFSLRLPTDELFLRTELTHDDDHRIVAVEGGVGR